MKKKNKQTKSKKHKVSKKRSNAIKRFSITYNAIKDFYDSKRNRKEILSDYHRIKDSCKNIPISQLVQCVDVYLTRKEKHEFPNYLQVFQWYNLKVVLEDAAPYFKDNDIIVLGLSSINEKNYEFKYSELSEGYGDFYQAFSNQIRELGNGTPPFDEPPADFIYAGNHNNKYLWNLMGEGEELKQEPKAKKQKPIKIPKQIRVKIKNGINKNKKTNKKRFSKKNVKKQNIKEKDLQKKLKKEIDKVRSLQKKLKKLKSLLKKTSNSSKKTNKKKK